MSDKIFEAALDINDPWYIENVTFDNATKRLDIHISFHRGSKFLSGIEGDSGKYSVYDTTLKSWRHLSFFEHEAYLHCKTPRIKLDDGKTKMVSPPWAGKAHGFTLLFEAMLIRLCEEMPVATVSQLAGIDDGKLWRILEKYVITARSLNEYRSLKAIGVDETSQKKGHDYVTLFVDLDERKTLYVTKGKDHETFQKFARDLHLHSGKEEQILDISCDMSPAFIKGAGKFFPEAKITFDKFHIIKILNEAVDKVRREEAKVQPLLKSTRYLWLKNESTLTVKEKTDLEKLKLPKLNLKSFRAMQIRENFQAIYQAESEKDFLLLLNKWYFWATHSRLKPIIKAAKTIKSHWDGITAWFGSRYNNGILEGLNSLIQTAKSRARGFRNFRYFRTMIYLITGDLNLSKVNLHYGRTHI